MAPGLVLSPKDEYDVIWAPFVTTGDGAIPRSITLESRAPFAPWESEENGPSLSQALVMYYLHHSMRQMLEKWLPKANCYLFHGNQ